MLNCENCQCPVSEVSLLKLVSDFVVWFCLWLYPEMSVSGLLGWSLVRTSAVWRSGLLLSQTMFRRCSDFDCAVSCVVALRGEYPLGLSCVLLRELISLCWLDVEKLFLPMDLPYWFMADPLCIYVWTNIFNVYMCTRPKHCSWLINISLHELYIQ